MKYIYLLLFLLSQNTFANIDIPISGCPTNAMCNKLMAKKFIEWNTLISNLPELSRNKYKAINNFIKKTGYPFKHWEFNPINFNEVDLKKEYISNKLFQEKVLWDSSCKHHLKAQPRIYEAITFLKNVDAKTLPPSAKAHFEKIYLQKGSKFISYVLPNSQTPSYIDGDKLYLNQDHLGNYYGLSLNMSGKVLVEKLFYPPYFPKKRQCPKKLLTHFLGLSENKIFSDYICMNIWDKKTNKEHTFIQGISCI